MLLFQLLETTASRHPERIALVSEEDEISYGLLADSAARLARGFSDLGLAPGDCLAILLPNSIELAVAVLAASRAELVLAALPLSHAPPQLARAISEAGAKALLTSGGLLGHVPRETLESLSAVILTDGAQPGRASWADLLASPPLARAQAFADPVGLICYTSGTTGRPKGFAHTQGRLVRRVEDFAAALSLGAEDVALTVFSIARPLCLVGQFLAMLQAGGKVVLAERPASPEFWRLYGRTRPTYALVMPAYANRILADPGAATADHSRLRFFLSAGDQPGKALCQTMEQTTGRPLLNQYGLTEAGAVTVQRPHGPAKWGAMGRPLPGVEMRLVDEAGREVPPGAPGRLRVFTPNMMAGPWRPGLGGEEAPEPDWLDTQDIARKDGDGDYWFLGRARDTIVRGAVNVSSALAAEELATHPAVAEAVLTGVPDPVEGQVPVAFSLLRAGAVEPGQEELRAWLAARVDADSVPVRFFFLEQWPVTAQGKRDRTRLAQMARERMAAS